MTAKPELEACLIVGSSMQAQHILWPSCLTLSQPGIPYANIEICMKLVLEEFVNSQG